MAHNKLYRNFIILQEDQRGYSASGDKALSGYAKVEAKGDKCKVSFYAQNLRQDEKYSMVLICCKKDSKQLIDLGPLTVNEVGKGDTSKEYYINNIAGLGISYDKISGAAICKSSNIENGFIMHGFMNGEEPAENWRKFKVVKEKTLNEEAFREEPIRVQEKPSNVVNNVVDEPKKEENIEVESKEEVRVKEVRVDEVNDKLNDEINDEINEGVKVDEVNGGVRVDEVNGEVRVDEVNDEINDEEINIEDGEDRHKKKKCDKKCDDKKCHEEKKIKDKKGEKEHKCECDDKKKHDHEKDEHIKKESKDDWKMCDKCAKKPEIDTKDIKYEDIEEYIKKIADKMELYDDIIDLDMSSISGDCIIYGFIKRIINGKCIWKKFKMSKEWSSSSYLGKSWYNSKRIDENVNLDSTDFDEYENDIEKFKNPNNFNINGKVGEYFENIASSFELYDNKLDDVNYCKWYKVNVNSIDDLCDESDYNKYTLAYYPMLNYYPYINKSNYFLLGYKCNKEGELQYIVYGIPGSKDKSEQPYGGKTGFVTWTNDNTRNQGYWLMFYDFKNSSIVVPMK